MEICVKTFSELTIHELHDLMQLRSQVFVVEQDCVYQDIDGKDRKALQILGFHDSKLGAYARCFSPGLYFEEAAIGRIVVDEDYRSAGYGDEIVQASIKAIEAHYTSGNIKLSAQTYLIRFYEKHSFIAEGPEYLEDGIPHIAMVKQGVK